MMLPSADGPQPYDSPMRIGRGRPSQLPARNECDRDEGRWLWRALEPFHARRPTLRVYLVDYPFLVVMTIPPTTCLVARETSDRDGSAYARTAGGSHGTGVEGMTDGVGRREQGPLRAAVVCAVVTASGPGYALCLVPGAR